MIPEIAHMKECAYTHMCAHRYTHMHVHRHRKFHLLIDAWYSQDLCPLCIVLCLLAHSDFRFS